MKKVLVVIDNLNRGGVASVVLNISNVMAGKAIYDYITYIEPEKFTIEKINNTNSRFFVINRLSKTMPWNYIKKIREIIRENGPYDAIHAHTSSFIWISCYAAKKEGISVRVGHAHGSKNVRKFLFSNLIYSSLRILNRKYCTKMITCADESGKYVFGKDYEFLPNFIDHDLYKDLSVQSRNNFMINNNLLDKKHILCFIGYLGGEKNPLFALKVFKEFCNHEPNSVLLMAGDGPEYDGIIDWVKEHQMSEKVIMFGNTNKIKEILQVSQIILMPSYSEGMSIALLEAQISGVECVVSNSVPITNDIKVGLFHQCSIANSSEWVCCITEIYKNYQRKSYVDLINGLINVKYDKYSVMNRLIEIYESDKKL